MKKITWKQLLKALAWIVVYWENIRKVLIAAAALAIIVVAAIMIRKLLKEEPQEMEMEKTAVTIESVRPRGEIYVCSAVIEDYAVKRDTVTGLFTGKQEHVCVQTLTQKCSYMLDLEKVVYEAVDSDSIVRVRLPKPQYVASTQGASFLSDDGSYWARRMPNTNALKRIAERKIKRRFDTTENQRKAERYAEEAISEVLKKLGYRTEFVRTLEKKDE